jgi:hypothetical protein
MLFEKGERRMEGMEIYWRHKLVQNRLYTCMEFSQ